MPWRSMERLRPCPTGALVLLLLAGCGPEPVSLPRADDPMFQSMADLRFGMHQSELTRQRPSLEPSPEGGLREAYASGWITYGFRNPMDPRLSSVRVWMELTDSVSLRERHEGLSASLSSAYGFDPACYRTTSNQLDEKRVVWVGSPSTGVSSQVFPSPDRRGYRAELVVLVADSALPLDREREATGCDELVAPSRPDSG